MILGITAMNGKLGRSGTRHRYFVVVGKSAKNSNRIESNQSNKSIFDMHFGIVRAA
jgi:hypothetical protein